MQLQVTANLGLAGPAVTKNEGLAAEGSLRAESIWSCSLGQQESKAWEETSG